MKATGIVRRIDDLGRVVIPKEIRRTQLIRVGDPLEIFVSGAGEVIFKKYSPIGELSAFAASYADVLYKAAGASVAIADRDRVVAAAGAARDAVERSLAPVYTRAVEQRRLFTAADAASASVMICAHAFCTAALIRSSEYLPEPRIKRDWNSCPPTTSVSFM